MKNNLIKHIVVLATLLCSVPAFAQSEEAVSSEQDEWQVTTVGKDLVFTVNGVSFTMKHVDGGSFQMGCADKDAYRDETPVHKVTVGSFYMGETEVTQALWQAVMDSNPSHFKGDKRPLENVNWASCQMFILTLSEITGYHFRLPTEAEWEYAARGGKKAHGCRYSGKNKAGGVAWFVDNSGNKTHNVKGKTKNELGLYDMSGNVWEWCADWYGNYAPGSYVDPQGPAEGTYRVLRGGCWNSNDWYCRVSNRSFNNPDYAGNGYGFRLVLQQSNESKE
jgi:formylglycine-generating enzyme required for sulfatase activity